MSFSYDFRRLNTKSDLCKMIGISGEYFDIAANFIPKTEDDAPLENNGKSTFDVSSFYFSLHKIPKKGKYTKDHFREVWEALDSELSDGYKSFSRRFETFLRMVEPRYPHPCSFGFIKNRNIKDNAELHCGHKYLVKADIQNFFTSIKSNTIQNMFLRIGLGKDVSTQLTRFVTIHECLPTGLSPSPMLANFICLDLDDAFLKLAEMHDATYTRYADDLSFSGNGSLPSKAQISDILQKNNFRSSDKKFRYSKRGQAHFVTGLSVSDPKQPHVPRLMKSNLRQEIYYCKKYGIYEHFYHLGISDDSEIQRQINRIDGSIKYLAHIEPNLGKKLFIDWFHAMEADNTSPSFKPKYDERAIVNIFVDETEMDRSSKTKLALALSVSSKQGQVDAVTKSVQETFLSDAWPDGNYESIKKHGLHFSDATQDLKLEYIKQLQTLPFKGYIVFGDLLDHSEYGKKYLELLLHILPRRLMACDGQFVQIAFEQNSKVSKKMLTEAVEKIMDKLRKQNNRRPLDVSVRIVSKTALGVSVPDFILGIFRQYAMVTRKTKDSETPREHLFFERIRDKIKSITDIDDDLDYTRRFPFRPWAEDPKT